MGKRVRRGEKAQHRGAETVLRVMAGGGAGALVSILLLLGDEAVQIVVEQLNIADLCGGGCASVACLAQLHLKRSALQDKRLDLLGLKQVENVGVLQSLLRTAGDKGIGEQRQNQCQRQQ